MQTEISTSNFKDMLKVMDKIKDSDSNQSTDLLVTNTNRQTKFIKSNLETTIVYSLDSYNNSNQNNESIILPNESAELIKKLKEDYLTLSDDKIKTNKKEISFTKSEAININTYEDIEKIFSVTQKELLRMLSVNYAVAQDDTRPILTGIYFNKSETCALDGYRMSIRVTDQYTNEHSFVVNQFSIIILESILKDSDNIINVYYNYDNNVKEGIVKFEVNDITIIAKCLEGEFINYKNIINISNCNMSSIVNPNDLAEEVDFIRSADGREYLKTIFTKDKIILKGNQCKQQYSDKKSNDDLNKRQKELNNEYKEKHDIWLDKKKITESKGKTYNIKEPKKKEAKFKRLYDLIPVNDIVSEVDCKSKLDGKDEFTIAYNPKYMSDGLKQYSNCDEVEIKMSSLVNPIYITKDGYNLELVLPVRIKE